MVQTFYTTFVYLIGIGQTTVESVTCKRWHAWFPAFPSEFWYYIDRKTVSREAIKNNILLQIIITINNKLFVLLYIVTSQMEAQ